MKKAVVIGAGVGGLTAGIYLARNGYRVTIHEKNPFAGGRCGQLITDGHRFDTGATLLMMTDVYRRIFADMGKTLEEELDLIRMDPIYSLRFPGKESLLVSGDLCRMRDQLETIEPGSYSRFLSYMDKSYNAYQVSMKHIIDRNYYSIFDFLTPVNIVRLARLRAFHNHYRVASRYFNSDMLRIAFTFQNIYVGQDPLKASAIFSMLPFLELTEGVWYPRGGMSRVTERLAAIADEHGIGIKYNSAVKEIKVEGRRASGLLFEDGGFEPADVIVANADLPYSYSKLLPAGRDSERIDRLKFTCSAIIFHWGMDRVMPGLEQHNVFVSSQFRQNIQAVFRDGGIADEPSFYLHAPSRSDPTAAPAGQDSVSVIVPVGSGRNGSEKDWEEIRSTMKNSVLKRLDEEVMPGFGEHIKFERSYIPPDWKGAFNISRGAIFGSLNHNIFQMGYFRPHNQHKKYKNLFFTGGSTHPGNGVPMCLLSARLVAEKVMKQDQ